MSQVDTERFYIVAQYTPDSKKYVAVDIQDSSSTFMDFYIREVVAKEDGAQRLLRSPLHDRNLRRT